MSEALLAGLVAAAVAGTVAVRFELAIRTARREAEAARRAGQGLRALLRRVPDAVAVVDAETLRVLDASCRFVALAGVPEGEVLGTAVHRLLGGPSLEARLRARPPRAGTSIALGALRWSTCAASGRIDRAEAERVSAESDDVVFLMLHDDSDDPSLASREKRVPADSRREEQTCNAPRRPLGRAGRRNVPRDQPFEEGVRRT